MNSKKAKRLRQLVEHLQTKGAIGTSEWAVFGSMKLAPKTSMLDPACGKAIYKQMKKRGAHHGKA
jgi:hypothetical protein